MKRLGAIVLFAGGVLLSTHILAPAEPPSTAARDIAAARAALMQAAGAGSQAKQVDAEVERLRERLAARPSYPAPSRDPFRFAARPAPPRQKPADAPAPPIADAPRVVLPQVIAIAATADASASARTAVLGIGDNVQVVKAGDTFAGFIVRSIGADAVELLESASGRTSTISLH